MNLRSVFQLKILYQPEEQSCVFALLWEGGNQSVVVHQKYSSRLQQCYDNWKNQYLKYYFRSSSLTDSSTQPIPTSGSIGSGVISLDNLISKDPSHNVREKALELVNTLKNWLGEREVRRVERIIQDELTRLIHQKPKTTNEELIRIDIYLACSEHLQKLPWEVWIKSLIPKGMAADSIRLCLTALDDSKTNCQVIKPQSKRKPRILAIIGDDPNLSLLEDYKIIKKSLGSVAYSERVEWDIKDSKEVICAKVFETIKDERGWDVIFYCGHSDEKSTNGKIDLTKTISLTIDDLEDAFKEACKKGLQLAIFNSCSGWKIAKSLITMGLQVVAMRESIDNQMARRFLELFTKQLGQFKDVHQCLIETCQAFKTEENIRFPSSDLLPSYFSPANTEPFQLEPFGWKKQVKQWLPIKRELVVLGILLPISLMVPIQDTLLDLRYLFQSGYQQFIEKILPDKHKSLSSNLSPPLILIEIDEASTNQMSAKGLEVDPIDLTYLAQLVDKLSTKEAKVIGIEYLLDRQNSREKINSFSNSIRTAVAQHKTWFVFNIDKSWKETGTFPPLIENNKNYLLYGHNSLSLWEMDFLKSPHCVQVCSFSSSLALSRQLSQKNQDFNIPLPKINSEESQESRIKKYLENNTSQPELSLIYQKIETQLGIRKAVNFSLPFQSIYKKFSALELLNDKLGIEQQQQLQNLNKKVVIIAPGDYDRRYKTDYSPPLAIEAWCIVSNWQKETNKNCSNPLTTGELYAYQVYHLINDNPITIIPDFWLMLMAIITGKGVNLFAQKQPKNKRKFIFVIAFLATGGYTIVCLNLYLFKSIVLPWFLPSLIFWLYLTPIFRRKLR